LFARYGVALTFEKEALTVLAGEARTLHLGARGLRRVVSQVLAPEEFDLPELARDGVTEMVVTEATARGAARATPIREFGKPKPEAPEQRKLFDSETGEEESAEVEHPRRRRDDLTDDGLRQRRAQNNVEI
jgi:hypothetical protein